MLPGILTHGSDLPKRSRKTSRIDLKATASDPVSFRRAAAAPDRDAAGIAGPKVYWLTIFD
jgi:hypothetical protein